MTAPAFPPEPDEGAAATATAPVRAEYPPPYYWRRWSDDAPAASAPVVADAPASAATGDAPSLLADSDEAPYRVLVVEDDPSQALFAEGVLRGAGIQARPVRTSSEVMPELEAFVPDLVLMDLHMPGLSGTELTALIRAHPAFAHTPIVFLTGDQDPERQFEALEHGADDFLSKPIRPRHLIAAVHSRIKRARALARQRADGDNRHLETGLYHRPHLLRSIASALATDTGGGALFVEIQNAGALRERYGYAGFEQLMNDAAKRLPQLVGACPCARLNDNAFLVFAAGCDAMQLEALARGLRDGIGHAPFDQGGMPQHLRVAIGYGVLSDFSDPGPLLDAIEQAARAARANPLGIAACTAPAPAADAADGLVASMRAGLREGTFELAFQPVVAVAGGEDAQFQVLLRMRDANGTVHRAGALVPEAEAAGLMPDIDRWVLEQAIELLHRRREEQRSLRLFVSQSPRTLARDLHAEWVREMLASHGIDGPSLVIDLRLDDALVHTVTLRHFSELLMPAGVQFCLSQYVHGPEADALLKQLPLGYLRLSPRYSHAHADAKLRDELRAMVERAHRRGLQVIGPQVENAQGAATLWMSGIDLIQGNLVQQADGELDFDFAHAVL
jgi:EAL domain-containing protein (putative c-di-GMP-specific phosphodiesterase class I)/PleD family two-component response regulator